MKKKREKLMLTGNEFISAFKAKVFVLKLKLFILFLVNVLIMIIND